MRKHLIPDEYTMIVYKVMREATAMWMNCMDAN